MSGLSSQPSIAIRHTPHTSLTASACKALLLLASSSLLPGVSYAQDEAFLQCADLSDREARVSCLETALDAAVRERAAAEAAPSAAPSTPAAPAISAAPVAPAAPVAAAPAQEAAAEERRFDLFGFFERQREAKPAEPSETMDGRVAELKFYKPDIWTVTLENGQVWRQIYAKRYNLREGDAVKIYSTNWGQQYRLEAERFNGFIQVERLK